MGSKINYTTRIVGHIKILFYVQSHKFIRKRYISSNLIKYLGENLLGFNDLCTVNALRATNILFSIGLYFILGSFFKKNKLYALTLAWFPVGHFYSFMYYTDSGSTFFVLLSYLLLKKKRYHLSGIVNTVVCSFIYLYSYKCIDRYSVPYFPSDKYHLGLFIPDVNHHQHSLTQGLS